jgi:hypothetical protein
VPKYKKIRLTAKVVFINFIVFYFLLLIVNSILYLRIDEKPRSIIDYNEIDLAKNNGFSPSIYPKKIFDNASVKSLSDKYNFIPLASIPNKNVFLCNEGYGLVKFKNDKYGFRNNDNEWDDFEVSTLLIGDSFVQGSCVKEDDTIKGILKLKGIKTLNLGIGDSSFYEYYQIINNVTFNRVPRNIVLIIYAGNDFMEMPDKYNDKINENYFFKKNYSHLSTNGVIFFKELEKKINDKSIFSKKKNHLTVVFKDNFKLTLIRSILRNNFQTDISSKGICILNVGLIGNKCEYYNSFTKIKGLVELTIKRCNTENNCNFFVTIIPENKLIQKDKIFSYFTEQTSNFLINNYEKDKKLKYIPLNNINFYKDEIWSPTKGHLSIKGYKDVSYEIIKYLKN